jgi:predicted nucleic acid-binding protein
MAGGLSPGGTAAVGPADAVLDTNVLLDWLVFDNPEGQAIGAAVMAGSLRWLVTPAMRDEATDVFGRLGRLPELLRWRHREAHAHAMLAAWATPVRAPDPLPMDRRARCTDPDDQVFVDLALSLEVPWLISRDRAVLKLSRRLSRWGVTVLTPPRWCALHGLSATGHPAAGTVHSTDGSAPSRPTP